MRNAQFAIATLQGYFDLCQNPIQIYNLSNKDFNANVGAIMNRLESSQVKALAKRPYIEKTIH
jgi:hypothetical protein